jgi:hypothetical protein
LPLAKTSASSRRGGSQTRPSAAIRILHQGACEPWFSS